MIVAIVVLGVFTAIKWFAYKQKCSREAEESEALDKVVMSLESHFKTMDVIVDGKRWLGTESEIIWASFLGKNAKGFIQHYLCKTNKDAWFQVRYGITTAGINAVEVSPLAVEEAQQMLSRDKALYLEHFPNTGVA